MIAVLLPNLRYSEHGREQLLALGCAEINTLLIILLKLIALDQSADFYIVLSYKTGVGPESSFYPFHHQQTLIARPLLAALSAVLVDCLLLVQLAIFDRQVPN